MTIELELQIACETKTLPHPAQFKEWVSLALTDKFDQTDAELTIRIVDEEEITELNRKYRKKNYPTNVLSFPVDNNHPFSENILGDIIICAAIVENEAKNNKIELLAHWAHMVIHGTLHLLGYDHIEIKQAEIMEKLETEIMLELGFANPYE